METILHVLNGGATLKGFQETGLDGDVLVWREVLSEGPLSTQISSADFWNARAEWIGGAFHVSPESYREGLVSELGKLNQPYQEINLWFEFDLHCQVNMLGVMMLLLQGADLSGPAVHLICPSEVAGVDDFRGMGQLSGDQLADLYDARLRLNEWEFSLAEQAWGLYIKGDEKTLANWINSNTFWGNLTLLKPALEAHLKRITKNENGLNFIEQTLINIYQSGLKDRGAIYQQFWSAEKIYGMGDAELNIYLDSLKTRGLIDLS